MFASIIYSKLTAMRIETLRARVSIRRAEKRASAEERERAWRRRKRR